MKTLGEFLRRFGIFLTACVLFVGLVVGSWKVKTTYSVTASTETTVLETPQETELIWHLPQKSLSPATIGSDQAGPAPQSPWPGYAEIVDIDQGRDYPAFAGQLHLRGGCQIVIERMLKGSLQVSIQSLAGDSVGHLKMPDETFVTGLGSEVFLELPDLSDYLETDRSLVLPIYGEIFVGNAEGIAPESRNPMLLSGELSLVDYSELGERFFQISSFELGFGDSLVIKRSDGENSSSHGFVRIDHNPAMLVVFRTVAWRAQIQRHGGRAFMISAGLRDTFLNNPYVNGVTSTFMTILLFIGGWRATKKV